MGKIFLYNSLKTFIFIILLLIFAKSYSGNNPSIYKQDKLFKIESLYLSGDSTTNITTVEINDEIEEGIYCEASASNGSITVTLYCWFCSCTKLAQAAAEQVN